MVVFEAISFENYFRTALYHQVFLVFYQLILIPCKNELLFIRKVTIPLMIFRSQYWLPADLACLFEPQTPNNLCDYRFSSQTMLAVLLLSKAAPLEGLPIIPDSNPCFFYSQGCHFGLLDLFMLITKIIVVSHCFNVIKPQSDGGCKVLRQMK